MNHPARILVMAGSLREAAWSKKVARHVAEVLRGLGAEVDYLELNEVEMPLYSQDIEDKDGAPGGALAFRQRLAAAEGFFFCSPEYNHSIPGVFKNAIDWASRGEDDVFAGKVACISGSSPGRAGGLNMLPHLRLVMNTLGVCLVPNEIAIAQVNTVFDEQGKLTSAYVAKQLAQACTDLVAAAQRAHTQTP